jgi:uncharacterized protein YndB with AHSA1/START domain
VYTTYKSCILKQNTPTVNVLKWILIGGVALMLAAAASTFFMSEDFRVYHTQIIKAPPEAVFNQINTIKNWENWSYWMGQDDKMQIIYNDIPAGVGASYSWKSNKKELGSGSLVIINSATNYYVQCKLSFDGFGDSRTEYILKPVAGGTELTAALDSPSKGIIDKLMARIMIRPMMEEAFKASADKLQAYLLSHPFLPTPTVLTTSDSNNISTASK